MKPFAYFSRLQKQIVAAIVDLIFLPLTFAMAVSLRYDGLSSLLWGQYALLIIAAPLVSIPIFIRLGLYRAVIRFIDHKIVYVVILGVSLSIVALAALAAFTLTGGFSRAVYAIYWISAILYVAASRFVARGLMLRMSGVSGATSAIRVAIYGAGQAGSELASALRTSQEYTPVAFIDDNKDLHRATIAGVKVFGADDLAHVIERYDVKEILLAMPSQSKAQQKLILDRLEPMKVKIKVTPPIKSLINGELRVQDFRDIEIEDLLGRDQVDPDPKLISTCIANKSVLVTGAGGSIGSELCRQIVRLRPAKLILLEMSEYGLYTVEQELSALQQSLGLDIELVPFLGSVLDTEKCIRIMSAYAVDTVYHAAAYKHVPLVEHNPIEGIRNNVFGTLSVARAATVSKVKTFVLISTDKAVRPTNVMGSTKRLAELILQGFARLETQRNGVRFCMVRFGNVLGSSGSVVPLFRKQIMAGGPITLTHPEITRYFMTIPEAAQLVLQAGAMGAGGDVFVLDMGAPVKIIDLAKRMVHLSGLEVLSESTPNGTIEINHVGLRPGEKLYEELLIGENVEGTEHPLILRAQEAEIPWPVLEELLAKLDEACREFNHKAVRDLLLQIVDEYAPQCDIEDFLWRAGTTEVVSSRGAVHKLHGGSA